MLTSTRGFSAASLDAMARDAGFDGFELIDAPLIDGIRASSDRCAPRRSR